MKTTTELFETTGTTSRTFATIGNGQFGNVVRTGWRPSKLGEKKKQSIVKALQDSDVDQVYMRHGKIYKLFLNGTERQLS